MITLKSAITAAVMYEAERDKNGRVPPREAARVAYDATKQWYADHDMSLPSDLQDARALGAEIMCLVNG